MRRALTLLTIMLLAFATANLGTAAPPPPSPITYVTVDDGTEIAVRIFYPDGYVPGNKYPTLVQIEGYGGAASPNDGSFVGDPSYIVLAISLRGTGCSGGQLELFSERSSRDGAWIIDNWIPNQSWSNGKVGIYGHSYGGLTGFLVASLVPDTTHLKAVAVSGLIDDFYRGILYPGGISNYGFPVLWGAALRPFTEHSTNASFYSDAHCAQNFAQHAGSDVAPPPGLAADTYGSPMAKDPITGEPTWGIKRGLLNYVGGIRAPIQLGQQYQDEQTGPRGGHVLWENIPSNVPKRIAISTGRHNPNDPKRTKRDWLDCWILNNGDTTSTTPANHGGASCGTVLDPAKRVMLYFESMGSDRLAPYLASDWPLPESDWRRYYLRGDGTLSLTSGNDQDVSYVSTGTGRHLTLDVGNAVSTGAPLAPYGFTTGLPDTARYTLDFTDTSVIAGPMNLTLYAKTTSADTDLWAEVLDRDTVTGATTFVQRGLLRASYNATFDAAKSQRTLGGDIYRPYYSYDAITPVIPGAINKYEVEVFPMGHVWRPGHQLVLQLHAPPANDPISTYSYEPNQPGVVTIVQDALHPTSILFPFMPTLPTIRSSAPACGSVVGEVCITPRIQ